jgi:glyoxylase-like metal-dependent hydrolase (beta-lactamase superfamily II)
MADILLTDNISVNIVLAMQPAIQPFFDPATWTVTYVVHDGASAAIVDSVLDYEPKSGRTRTASADQVIAFVRGRGLKVEWILETHAHADHLSAAPYLRAHLGGRIAIGERIREVQAIFREVFNLEKELPAFDHLFADGERFAIGALEAQAMHVPGHTPADMAYRIGDAVLVGDTLFMPDVGTARADFPGGDARTLHRSIRRLLALPPQTRIFVCHDYPPKGREPRWETTVAEQRAANIHVRDGVSEDEFVALRTARDRTLEMPTLILPSIQVNIRAGELPLPEANGRAYLKIPLNAL